MDRHPSLRWDRSQDLPNANYYYNNNSPNDNNNKP